MKINLNTEFYGLKELGYSNREISDMFSGFTLVHNYVHDGITLKDQHVRQAAKIEVLRNLNRFTTSEICKKYNVKYDKEAVWLEIYDKDYRVYFAVIHEDGVYYKANIVKLKYELNIRPATKYGTRNNNYRNMKFAYSEYIFDTRLGIPEHILVCVAQGLYDEMSLNDIAISSVNHKNRDHFDNRPCNLEVLTSKENTLHANVTDELIELGVFRSMDYVHCKKYKELTSEQKDYYIKEIKEEMRINDNEWINNILLDKII